MNNALISSQLKVANTLKASKKFSLAAALYQEIIEQYPLDFRAYFNLGQLKLSLGLESNVAIGLFQKVLELDPTIIDTYGILGGLYIKMHQPLLAIEYCRKGLSVVCNDSSCLYNLNVALRQCGRIQEAVHDTWIATSVDRSKYNGNYEIPSSSSSGTGSVQLTVVCIKWGTKYSAQYVNNLYRAVNKHYGIHHQSCPLKFICFTDDSAGIDEGVQCLSFDSDIGTFKAWWLKVQVFSPKLCTPDKSTPSLLSGWILYIDLDTVICNSIAFLDAVITTQTDTGIITTDSIYVLNAEEFQNEARPRGINSSMMLWHAGHHTSLYTCLVENYNAITKCIYKFDHYLEMMLYHRFGSSISDISVDARIDTLETIASGHYLQDIFPRKIVDYVSLKDRNGLLDCDECAIICFPLKPKPHEVSEDWIRVHWDL